MKPAKSLTIRLSAEQADALERLAVLHERALLGHTHQQTALDVRFILAVPQIPAVPQTENGTVAVTHSEHDRQVRESLNTIDQLQAALSALDMPATLLPGPAVLDLLWGRMSPASARERPELAPSLIGGMLPELHEPLGVGEAQLHARQISELVCTDAIDLTSPGRVRIDQTFTPDPASRRIHDGLHAEFVRLAKHEKGMAKRLAALR